MKRPRPHIPLSVRVQVAERQLHESNPTFWAFYVSALKGPERIAAPWTLTRRLRVLLGELFPDGEYQLDHDPALILRWFSKGSGKYSPRANNPDYLIYRSRPDHQQKTTGRKPGALRTVTTKGSDIGLKTKFARLERKKTKPPARRIYSDRKIASRPFQKGRKLHGKPTN